jgi:hypothetical protein
MPKHRRTTKTVPNNPHPDNFYPADAFESLDTDLIQLEAFAHFAGEAAQARGNQINCDPSPEREMSQITGAGES